MLTSVIVFVLLVVAVLAIPLSLTYDLSTRTGYKNDLRVAWAFGLLHFRMPTNRPATADAERTKPVDTGARRSSACEPGGFAIIRQKAFRRRVIRYAGDLWRAIHKEDVRVNIRVGLGDPASTGQLWAFAGPIAGMLTVVEGAAVSVVPDFFDATLELNSHGNIRIVPLHVLYLTAALLLSPPIWRGLAAMQRAR
jgi:hypothetical protein